MGNSSAQGLPLPGTTSPTGRDRVTSFGSIWTERWGDAAVGRLRQSSTEFVLPRQQMRRDCLEAQRVASLFEHLEHMDDALSLPSQRSVGHAAESSSYCVRRGPALHVISFLTAMGVFLTKQCLAAIMKCVAVVAAFFAPLSDFHRTLLVHAAALGVAYVVFGPLFRWLSLSVLRAARKRGSSSLAQAVYLNGILLDEERWGCSILCAWGVNFSWWSSADYTRRILLRPCICLLLLLLTSGLRKLLEFAFLNSKLRTRFEVDVLTNSFERAVWFRLADLPVGALAVEGQRSPGSDEASAAPIMPDLDAPHVFERRTAEMLRTAFCTQGGRAAMEGVRQAMQKPHRAFRRHTVGLDAFRGPHGQIGQTPTKRVTAESLKDLLRSSSTIFLMQAEGRYDEIEAKAQALFQQLARSEVAGTTGSDAKEARLSRADLAAAMPKEDAERTWQMLVCTGDGAVNASADQRGSVSEQDFVAAFRATFERFHVIAGTVKDYAAIWFVFSDLLALIQAGCTIGIVLGIFFSAEVIRTVCISISTAFLGLSFVFGGLLREIFESVVHILLMNPYDVGDRIQLLHGNSYKIFTVQKINILTTEVRDLFNQTIYLKNSSLFQGTKIVNLARSLNAVVELGFEVSASQASNALVAQLKDFVRSYIAEEAAAWVPTYLRSFSPVTNGTIVCDLSGAVTHRFRLMHRKPWQNIKEVRQDVTRLVHAVLSEMRRLKLDFRLPVQPVHLEGVEELRLETGGQGGTDGRPMQPAHPTLAQLSSVVAQPRHTPGMLRQASFCNSDLTELTEDEVTPSPAVPLNFLRDSSPL